VQKERTNSTSQLLIACARSPSPETDTKCHPDTRGADLAINSCVLASRARPKLASDQLSKSASDTLSRGRNITPVSTRDIPVSGKPLWHLVTTGRKLSAYSQGHQMRVAIRFKNFRSPRAEPLLCLATIKTGILHGASGKIHLGNSPPTATVNIAGIHAVLH